ncbi:MAG: Fe2+-dependent dioxygenase [Acidobacteriota bacterium]
MLLQVDGVFSPQESMEILRALQSADWVDGRVTAGPQSRRVKDNLQLPENHPLSIELGARILEALERHPLFMRAALPAQVFPPLFNRYEGGQAFGTHVDNAIRQVTGTPHRVRTDLSATLFFSPPESYEGGELVVEDTYGTHQVKLPAGDLILYPSTSLHHVRPVTRGARICSFFWIQSMVREDSQRTLMFDLDVAIQRLASEAPDHPSAIQLTGIYHNLLRMWAEV